jgi:hypothetical protein
MGPREAAVTVDPVLLPVRSAALPHEKAGDAVCLSLYDLSGIQRYIFGSNRLQENIGASHLVQQALDVWLAKATSAEPGTTVKWSGGGNALVQSPDQAAAKRVATSFSACLHERAPGLSVACGHAAWDREDATFSESLKAARAALDRDKTGRAPAATFDGAGVTAQCGSTGEPALQLSSHKSDKREPSRWEGPATVAKLDAVKEARSALEGIFDPGLGYPADLDWLGRTRGESSFIGVIHIDGNGMGKRFKDAADRGDGGKAMKTLSDQVRAAGTATLKGALEWVSLHLGHFKDPKKGGFELFEDRGGVKYFPVRPIVFGGDDITVVCEGRIALDLAARFLELWHESTAKAGIEDCHACAGVALIKSHYPFFRAYELASELCRGAKEWLTEKDLRGSALDYEIAAGGALLSLGERRARDIASGGRKERLHVRPYLVVGEPPLGQPYRRWSWFRRDLLGVLQQDRSPQDRSPQDLSWKDFRTQLHALAPVLRQGSEATSELFRQWQDRFGPERALPVPKGASLSVSGFTNGETPYLDAVELLDMLVHPVSDDKEGAQ